MGAENYRPGDFSFSLFLVALVEKGRSGTMEKFVGYVFTDRVRPLEDEELDLLLEPYSGNVKVPPYIYMVDNEAFGIIEDEVPDKLKSMDLMNNQQKRIEILEEIFWSFQIDDKMNVISTFNPNARWDWWCMGQKALQKHTGINVNVARAKEVNWDKVTQPKVYINSKGEWFERGLERVFGKFIQTRKNSRQFTNGFKKMVENAIENNLWVAVVNFHHTPKVGLKK